MRDGYNEAQREAAQKAAEEQAVEIAPGVSAIPPDAPEPKTAEPMKAWVVAYDELGLFNFVAESQEELVERLNVLRHNAGFEESELKPIEVLSNDPSDSGKTIVWIDPLRIQAVLGQFEPRPPRGQSEMPPVPPGLLAALLGRDNGGPASEEGVAVVVVEPEPVAEPPEPEPKSG